MSARRKPALPYPRTAPTRASVALHAKLLVTNPHIKKLVENVHFHPSLRDDSVKFQAMWSDKFYSLNASDYGSPSSRPRQYMADFVRLDDLPPVTPLYPSAVLPSHRHCKSPHMPCLVASKHTHRVLTVYDSRAKLTTRLTAVESEVMQGWPPDITNGTDQCLHSPYETRLRHVGNALNNSQLYYILRHYTPVSGTACNYPAPASFATAAALEEHLGSLSDAGLRQWMQRRVQGWDPEPLF